MGYVVDIVEGLSVGVGIGEEVAVPS